MEDQYLDYEKPVTNQIPPFLKVLCILTFVGSGMGILGGIYAAAMNDFTIRTMEMSQNNPFVVADYTEYIARLRQWGVLAGILNIVASGLCLAGALMMWKLKKTGYFVYVIGQIIPFIVMYGLIGTSPKMGGGMQAFMVLGQAFAIIFPLAFVIMYTVNLKHLK